jgi:hypothetical protein
VGINIEVVGPLVKIGNVKGKKETYKVIVHCRRIVIDDAGDLDIEASHSNDFDHFVNVKVDVKEKNGEPAKQTVLEIPLNNYDEVIQVVEALNNNHDAAMQAFAERTPR